MCVCVRDIYIYIYIYIYMYTDVCMAHLFPYGDPVEKSKKTDYPEMRL